MDVKLTDRKGDGNGDIWDLSGTAVARPFTAATRGTSVNFYMASPFYLYGTYDKNTHELSVQMVTKSDMLSAMTMKVTAKHGAVSLPVSTCVHMCMHTYTAS